MSRAKRVLLGICLLAVVGGLVPGPALASVINVTSGQTLFYDDFEGLQNAVSHTKFEDATADYNPVASMGTWAIGEAVYTSIQVTDSTTSPDPGTLQGKNYLRIQRQYTGGGENGQATANFTTLQSTQHDHIRIREKVFIAPNTEITPYYMTAMGSSNRYAIGVFANGNAANGSIDYYAPEENVYATGLTFTAGAWQTWQIDYNIGENNMLFSLDGGTPVSLAVHSPGDLQCIILAKGSVLGTSVYVDEVAVPEPAGITLVTTGLLGLAAWAWCKRK